MSCWNTSQRPPEETIDRLRLGRVQSSTSSARREKEAARPPLDGRGRGGGTRLGRVDVAGGSSSQTGPSQTVDPTQYQQHYEEYKQAQNQAYYEEPHHYHFDGYQQHQCQAYQQHDQQHQPVIEQEQSVVEQEQSNVEQEQPQQQRGERGCRLWSTRPDRMAMEGAF